MPARISRSSVSIASSRPAPKKNQKRTRDRLTAATQEEPERIKIRQHRLGVVEDDNPRRKRQRLQDDDSDDEPHASNTRRLQQKKVTKGRFDELDVSEGSDSEGNHWTYGQVDEDDDESVDSDEAFGESDEERFEGFAFRGSSSGKRDVKKRRQRESENGTAEVDLNEKVDGHGDGEEDDDDLGEEAVDLATALDQSLEDEMDQDSGSRQRISVNGGNEHSEEEDSAEDENVEDEASQYTISDAEDERDGSERIAELQGFIASLDPGGGAENKKQRFTHAHESSAPSEFGLTSSTKISLQELLPGVVDRDLRISMKKLVKGSKPAQKLDVPLPKRQQNRQDRQAANAKANETLQRWVDTVKHNRRAEHISFPIQDPEAAEPLGSTRLLPTTSGVPHTDLESATQNIMQESGISTAGGKSEEDRIREFEELQMNKMPIEEVLARRVELRKARELLFREEVRAKRIKKIKSKSYRRVHRKERERNAQLERDAFAAAGIDVSEEERERNDRRRAEARMGAKHRESKWARSVKQTGRAAWDDDVRADVTEMARRNEELRKRIEGKEIRNEDKDDDTDITSDNEDAEDHELDIEDDGVAENRRLQRQFDRVNSAAMPQDHESKLSSMAFMQRAEAARKMQNNEAVERLRRELAGEETSSEEEEGNAVASGRKTFGPRSSKAVQPPKRPAKAEFEERTESDDEGEGQPDEVNIVLEARDSRKEVAKQSRPASGRVLKKKPMTEALLSPDTGSNPWMSGLQKTRPRKSRDSPQPDALQLGLQPQPKEPSKAKKSAAKTTAPADVDGWTTVTYRNGGDDAATDTSDGSGDEVGAHMPFVLRNQELVSKAFAGDDVVADFEAEKAAMIEAEDDKVIDNTLPGWGSWTGEGISKREQKRNRGRFITKVEGIKPAQRKDTKLEKVIINHARVKKNAKFLASSLPFPFESRAEYERSIRMPLGPEFQTKTVFQDATKPRVLLKAGRVIRPMEKPLL